MSNDRKLIIVDDVKRFLEEHGKFPTWKEIEEVIGVPRRSIRRLFGSRVALFEEILISGEPILTEARAKAVKAVISTNKTFFITTAVSGAPVFKEALQAVKNSFCKKTGAQLLVIPCADPAAKTVSSGMSQFLQENLVIENVDLNSNIGIQAIRLSAKQINPTTGLGRMGQRNKSIIFASPKQSLEFVPISNNKMPHALMTTGAITLPAYDTEKYMSQRTAYIAEHDHILGGLIVEIEDDSNYHFRTVTFSKDGSFTDLGTKYSADGSVKFTSIKVLTLGDRHVGSTCPMVKSVTDQMIQDLKPENLILHDLFNGTSINHHVSQKPLTKARMPSLTLKEEGALVRKDLEELASHKSVKKLYVVKSNHDEWIDRYLEEFRFQYDSVNLELALTLSLSKLKGHDTLKTLVGVSDKFGLNDPLSKVCFLKRDEDLIFNGVQYGCHGDQAHKGMSYVQLEKAYGQCTVGHSHTPGIVRGVRKVGTSTHLRESYATGPISWVNCHEIQNQDGSRQLINIYNGKYRA